MLYIIFNGGGVGVDITLPKGIIFMELRHINVHSEAFQIFSS